ncbi:protein of unknown function [Lachnospiraceae bacterium]|nr:protein of unknown function [Lachnospiraceae bacterium]
MGNMYNIGEIITADGDNYRVLGRITYLNKADGKTWDEYRLRAENFNNEERWLSVDYAYNEYSLSKKNPFASTSGYHLVDRGTAKVAGVAGDVDVEIGDEVIFEEYEDHTEEKIVSIEHWDDEDEYSSGYYLDPWEFGREGEIRGGSFSSGLTGKTTIFGKAIIIIIFVLAFMGSSLKGLIPQNKKIEPYLKKQTFLYEYVTSITGEEKQKANVYEYLSGSSLLSNYSEEEALNKVAQDIIDGINGNSSAIQQNDEKDDHTVAILTSKEYCIIYRSEDDKILVQVSSRKYAYSTDKEPYRSRNRTRRYYRRFYYSTGYNDDSGSYSRYHSSYDGYSDGTVTYDSNNGLNNYSNSVRQSSIASRSSDGGGLSSGK